MKQLDFSLLSNGKGVDSKGEPIRCANMEESLDALGKLTSWSEVHAMCKAHRPQPLSPARFKEVLAGKKFRSRPHEDEDLVNKLYKNTFKGVFSEAEELDFSGLDWKDVKDLQDTLSNAAEVTEGETCPNLKVLWLLDNKIAEPRTAKESLQKALGNKVRIFGLDPSGLQWRNVGEREPAGGVRLDNKGLAKALSKHTVGASPIEIIKIKEEQWKTFGIKNLDWPNFIQSGDSYFQPVDGSQPQHVMTTTSPEDAVLPIHPGQEA